MGFNEQVWELCKHVPKGKVTTYRELAHALGTKAYQAVGNALNKNPYSKVAGCRALLLRVTFESENPREKIKESNQKESPDFLYAPIVPCHRVVNSDGRVGGFAFGVEKKIALLKEEGVVVDEGRVDLAEFLCRL